MEAASRFKANEPITHGRFNGGFGSSVLTADFSRPSKGSGVSITERFILVVLGGIGNFI